MGRAEAEAATVTATLQYAKRQRTWFRHQLEGVWCTTPEEARAAVVGFLGA